MLVPYSTALPIASRHPLSHAVLFLRISFMRATAPLLVHDMLESSGGRELRELLGDATSGTSPDGFEDDLYSPSTYTASLVHVLRFLRWT